VVNYWFSNLLAAILGRPPGPRDKLFDVPRVDRDAPALVQARGLADRIMIEGGSTCESVPTGGDAYLLSHIIHDWTEDQWLTILGNWRRAMKASSRLPIIEIALPTRHTHPGKMLDVIMLAVERAGTGRSRVTCAARQSGIPRRASGAD